MAGDWQQHYLLLIIIFFAMKLPHLHHGMYGPVQLLFGAVGTATQHTPGGYCPHEDDQEVERNLWLSPVLRPPLDYNGLEFLWNWLQTLRKTCLRTSWS